MLVLVLACCQAEELDLNLDDIVDDAEDQSGCRAFGPHLVLMFAMGALAALL